MNKLISFVENDLNIKRYESKQIFLRDLDDYEESVIISLFDEESTFEFIIDSNK